MRVSLSKFLRFKEFRALESYQRFHIKFQRNRALVYSLGILLATLAKGFGFLGVSWVVIIVFLLITSGSSAFFAYVYYYNKKKLLGVPVHVFWMTLDVILFGLAMFFTGGARSVIFPWGLANVAASAYVAGKRTVLSVMTGNLIVYLLAVLAKEGFVYQDLLTVIVKMVILYGAAFFAILGIINLRKQTLLLSQVKEAERRRAEEFEELAKALETKTNELIIANEKLQQTAITDALTGLYNRHYIEHRIKEDIAEIQRKFYGKNLLERFPDTDNDFLGLIMIDIDKFKEINDIYGHDSGDLVLYQFARVLTKGVRALDSVVRWGGEEFLVIIRRVNFKIMEWVVERITKMVRANEFVISGDRKLNLSCSAGFCCYPFYSISRFSWVDVVNIADSALLLAKKKGRNIAIGVKEGDREIKYEDMELIKNDPLTAEKNGIISLIIKK